MRCASPAVCPMRAGWPYLRDKRAHCVDVHAYRRLSLADRATMVPLLAAVVDFDSSQETYERYDSMTALELFQKCVRPSLVDLPVSC